VLQLKKSHPLAYSPIKKLFSHKKTQGQTFLFGRITNPSVPASQHRLHPCMLSKPNAPVRETYLYHGVSSKFLDYYLALFYWVEKNKGKTYLEQAYDIITLLANQTKKIPLAKFKYKPISFDMKRLAI